MNDLRRAAALTMILPVLSLAACGGSDSDTTSESPAPSTEESAAPAESESQSGENAPAPSGEAVRSEKVTISGFQYDPETVTIQAGGKVIWQNEDSTEHTATLDDGSFTTGALAEGKLKSESFKTAGTYTYHCEIHPQMKGTVEVVEAG
jgi:plastocyanin